MKQLLFIVLIIAIFICCGKSPSNSCYYDAIPASLILRLSKLGVNVPDTIVSKVKIYYYQGTEKNICLIFQRPLNHT